jgi:DNA-binding XRE family transcriptional regulator
MCRAATKPALAADRLSGEFEISDFGIRLREIVKGSLVYARGVFLKSGKYVKHYRAFLSRLSLARSEAGYTQAEIARKLSNPRSFISKCESGERRVDLVELQHLARIYRKSLSFFEIARPC